MAPLNRSIVFSFPLRFLSIFTFLLTSQVMSGVRGNTETFEALKDLAKKARAIYDIIEEVSKLIELTPNEKPKESHKNLFEKLDKNDFSDLEPLVKNLVTDLKAVKNKVIDVAVTEIHNVNDTNLKKQLQQKVSDLYKGFSDMNILYKKHDELKKSYPPKPTTDANDQNVTEPEISPSTSKSDDEGRSSTPMAETGGQDQNVTEADGPSSAVKQVDQDKSTTAKPESEESDVNDVEPKNRQSITTSSSSAKPDDKGENSTPRMKTEADEKDENATKSEASFSTIKPEEESDKREDNTRKDDGNNSNRSGLFPFLDWLKAVIHNTKIRIRNLGKALKVNEGATTLQQVTSTTVRTTELTTTTTTTTTTKAPIKKEKGNKKKSSKTSLGPFRSWISSYL